MKLELFRSFANYLPIFKLGLNDGMRKLADKLAFFACYTNVNIVGPLSLRLRAVKQLIPCGCAVEILFLPISSANIEGAFSMLLFINQKEFAAIFGTNEF